MNDNFGADVLNNPDKYTLFTSPEQLMDVYGDMFEHGKLYRTDIYLEKDLYADDSKPDSRFITTSAGLTTIRGDGIWELDINDQDFLEQVNKGTIMIKISIQGDGDSFDKDVIIHGKDINITYEPYTVETTEYVMRELDERRKLLQKKD